jgi:2-polyprenyl-3-methyl-5-hydroxy-6-metoxy-1,4-benzoquinol methylase
LKIGIIVVTYKHSLVLESTLSRIPKEILGNITEILILDDASPDFDSALSQRLNIDFNSTKLTFVHHEVNKGYGGNQKFGYNYAIDNKWDFAILLHGDGQYAPELIPKIVGILLDQKPIFVFGSRMQIRSGALRGGMPKYKFFGNIILSKIQNLLTNSNFSEWHSGYRAYSVEFLSKLNFKHFSNYFDFDTQIMLAAIEAEGLIEEFPIPTYYGSEISRVNGIIYAYKVILASIHYKLFKMGFRPFKFFNFLISDYPFSKKLGSSHQIFKYLIEKDTPKKILDIGCGNENFFDKLQLSELYYLGIDKNIAPGLYSFDQKKIEFKNIDLESPNEIKNLKETFDIIILGDVLEHLKEPQIILEKLRYVSNQNTKLLISVPNINFWYPRIRIALGLFNYDQRGPLDQTHLRFFRASTLTQLLRENNYVVEKYVSSRSPFSIINFYPISLILRIPLFFQLSLLRYQVITVAKLK